MTVYEAKEFTLEHQESRKLCWAAVVKAILDYFKMYSPTQGGLVTTEAVPTQAQLADEYGSGQKDPGSVLEKRKCTSTALLGEAWKTKATKHQVNERETDLHWNIALNLPNGPMLCGLTEANDAKWTVGGKTDTWRHATLLYKYDDKDNKQDFSSGQVSIKDPARAAAQQTINVSIGDLVNGFDYCSVADLGTKAAQDLQGQVSGMIRARIYRLEWYKSPFGGKQ